MQIQSLNIERFGRKQDLFVDGLADRLNVIYGPNGSGKSTSIQFVRWMLYGNCDDTASRYIADVDQTTVQLSSHGTASGSISFVEHGRRRSMSRQDDGSRYGRVALDGGSHYAKQANHLVSLLGDISQSDFDLLFAPDLDRQGGLASLLQSSFARGIDLTSQRIPSEKVQELRLRIDDFRGEMDRLPFTSGDLSSLLDRKRAVERKIDEMEHESRRRRDDYDREFQEVTRRIEDGELEIARLRTDWHSRDEQVAARRRELEEAWKVADQARQEYLARRRNELAEIEANLARARSMQSDVQLRRDRLEGTLRDSQLNLDRNPSELEETVCLVQSIARQLDEIKTENATVAETVTPYRSVYRYHGTPPATSTSIDALRTQVGRLCSTLQQERTEDRVRAMAAELEELRQTDAAMQRWVRGLVAQQSHIQRELDDAQRFGISLVVDRARRSLDGVSSLDDVDAAELQLLDTLETGRIRAVGHTCDGYEPVHPEQDGLLQQLTRQRDAAQESLQAAERELRHLMERRRDLEDALSRLGQQNLESARRELAEVDVLIRAAEERDRYLREIAKLEDEIARLRDTVRNSPVTEHAAKILRRLTRGRYRSMRIDNTRDVSVEDESESMVPVEHLSRGIRDQVYLSFCLAIITAHRRRGTELPLILNDAFTNVDSEKDDTLGDVLREFADSGQQVIVFTCHHHVANLLRNLGARFLELGAVTPHAPPVSMTEVEHVRFRPRGESFVTDRTTDHRFMDGNERRPIQSTFPSSSVSPLAVSPLAVSPPAVSPPAVSPPAVSPPVRTVTDYELPQPERRREPKRSERSNRVWDDGINEYSAVRDEYPVREASRHPVNPLRAGEVRRVVEQTSYGRQTLVGNVPFENVTFTNEVPLPSHVRSASLGPSSRTQSEASTALMSSAPAIVNKVATVESTTLTRSTPLDATGTVDAAAASRLRALGIVAVGDFLEMAPADALDHLRKWGLDSRPVRRWQDQLSLRCDLPGMAADDARLLVACGVCGIRDLAEADLDVLYERMEHLISTQRSRSGGRYVIPRGSYSRDHVAGWIRSAGKVWSRMRSTGANRSTAAEMAPPYESEYDPNYVYTDPRRSGHSSGNEFDRAQRENGSGARQNDGSDLGTGAGSGQRGRTLARSEYDELDVDPPTDHDRDGYDSADEDEDDSDSSRSNRSGRSTRRSSRGSSRSTSASSSSSSRSSREPSGSRSSRKSRSSRSQRKPRAKRLRFYLAKSDPVVDAPTIGPSMAKRLIAIGIHTVGDLLAANAATVAAQLNHDRTDAATVTSWVQQSVLACRIPKLRGHDAQILVACGIVDPDTLAAMLPEDLWGVVRPFLKTSECKRIIRNGKAPDKDEIQDWIEWAQSARELTAA